jgi:hypothetical protein
MIWRPVSAIYRGVMQTLSLDMCWEGKLKPIIELMMRK